MSLRRQRLPDFLRPVSGPGAWAWAWCATGLAVLAAAGLDALAAHAQRQQALQALGRLSASPMTRALGATPGAAATAPSMTSAGPGAAVAPSQSAAKAAQAWQSWQAWEQRLAYPWPQVFLAAEAAAADGVAWLSLAHTPGQEVLLEGEASSPAVALGAVAQLQRWVAGDGSAWREASLLRLERLERPAPGQRLAISLQGAGGGAPILAAGPRQP